MSAVDAYIKKINELLQNADLELLDFTFQFLQKSVEKPLTSSPTETHQQPAWHLQAVLRQADLNLQL